MKDPYKVLKYPISTEKAVREMEASNSLIFIVDRNATKEQIKKAAELAFDIKVVKIRTMIGTDNKKKAYIKLHHDYPAIDITTQLGLV